MQKKIKNPFFLKILKTFENCSLEMQKNRFSEKLMGLFKPP